MLDTTFIYTDFVLTLSRLHATISALLKKESSHLDIGEITISQALYMMYLVDQSDVELIEDRRINSKNFYYTLSKLISSGYVKTKLQGKVLKSIHATKKGGALIQGISQIFEKHIRQLLFNGMVASELSHILTLIHRFEKFWLNKLDANADLKTNL